jgi:hypothetical protein
MYRERYRAPEVHADEESIRKVIPLMYVAKYEPSSEVRHMIQSIWDVMVERKKRRRNDGNNDNDNDNVDKGKSCLQTTEVQEEILKHLIHCLQSSSWREREASCSALEAFLPRRSWSAIKAHYIPLFEHGIRVLDDMNMSTRTAALGFMKVLSDHFIRASNPAEAESADSVINAVDMGLPMILDKGLISSSPEIRGFSLGVLIKLIQTTRVSLKHWLPRLVAVLVESMSALEPRTLQYMQFHTARLQMSDQDLEALRLKLSQNSPMQEALDGCLQVQSYSYASYACHHVIMPSYTHIYIYIPFTHIIKYPNNIRIISE